MNLYLLAIGLILVLLLGGIVVDRIYRRFTLRHPELGPLRQSHGGGCGSLGAGSCSDTGCETRHS